MPVFQGDFNFKEIEDDFKAFTNQIDDDAFQIAKAVLTALVDKARQKANFNNITWDLRGSIGGVILRNHQIEFRYFPPLTKGEEGAKTGLSYAEEIAALADDGDITIVFVAGMDYAAFVEAKGLDVITGSSLHFEDLLTSLLTK